MNIQKRKRYVQFTIYFYSNHRFHFLKLYFLSLLLYTYYKNKNKNLLAKLFFRTLKNNPDCQRSHSTLNQEKRCIKKCAAKINVFFKFPPQAPSWLLSSFEKNSKTLIFWQTVCGFPKLHFFRILAHCAKRGKELNTLHRTFEMFRKWQNCLNCSGNEFNWGKFVCRICTYAIGVLREYIFCFGNTTQMVVFLIQSNHNI